LADPRPVRGARARLRPDLVARSRARARGVHRVGDGASPGGEARVKRYVLPAIAGLAAVGGAVALVVIAAGGGAEPRVAPPAGDPVEMETSVTPSRYLFGDALLAEVRLSIDRTRVDP